MKDRRWIALCAIGLIVLATLNLPDAASSRVKGAVRDGISPLQAALRGGVRDLREIIRYIRGIGDLALENRALSEELVYLRGEMRIARELERDNRMLRDLLGFVQRFPNQLVSCEVIGRDSTGWWQTVRLARSGVLGIMQGLGAGPGEQPACRMDYVARTADVQQGDEVVTSGMGGLFPKGLLVGRVARVETDPSGLYQRAWIDIAADLGRAEYAFVAATESDLAAAAKGLIEELTGPAPGVPGGETP